MAFVPSDKQRYMYGPNTVTNWPPYQPWWRGPDKQGTSADFEDFKKKVKEFQEAVLSKKESNKVRKFHIVRKDGKDLYAYGTHFEVIGPQSVSVYNGDKVVGAYLSVNYIQEVTDATSGNP